MMPSWALSRLAKCLRVMHLGHCRADTVMTADLVTGLVVPSILGSVATRATPATPGHASTIR